MDSLTILALKKADGGGGGGGLEYETGTYTPASDIAKPTISFANAHTTRPFCVLMQDVTDTLADNNSCLYWTILSFIDFSGDGFKTSDSSAQYARVQYMRRYNDTVTQNGTNVTSLEDESSSASEIGYHLTTDRFIPYSGYTTCYWRSGRTYKWIAVWAPSA